MWILCISMQKIRHSLNAEFNRSAATAVVRNFFDLIISEFHAVVSIANNNIQHSVAPFKVRVSGNEMRLPLYSHANENPTASSVGPFRDERKRGSGIKRERCGDEGKN